MTDFTKLAAGSTDVSNQNGGVQLFAGESDIVTTQGKLVTGVAYVAGQVLARVAASGLFAKHAPAASDGTEKAIAILAYDVAVPTAGKQEAIYTGGVFNIDALTFNAATNTDDLKKAAFDGTNIVGQKLLGTPAANSGPV
jgi:hypothetical protein